MVPNSIMITALKRMLVEPIHDNAGICFNLRHELLEMFDKGEWVDHPDTALELLNMKGRDWAQFCFDRMLKHWPKADLENPMYPIAGGKPAYAENEDYMWDEHHHYGALRRELCQFCIDYLENEDGNHKPNDIGSPSVN